MTKYSLNLVQFALCGLCVHGSTLVYAEQVSVLPAISVIGEREADTTSFESINSTGSRLGVSIKEIPASVEVIDRESMRERGDRTVVEAVSKAAGVTGGVTGGTPGLFSVRGFTNNGVTWLYDGVRVPGGTGMSARVMDTANVDRVEVLRGPASVLNGEGGTGATINLVSRAASFSEQPEEVDYTFSSYDSHRLHLGTGGAINDEVIAFRADISTSRYGSDVDDEEHALDRFTGSLLFQINDDLSTTLEVDKMQDESDNFYWGTPMVDGKLQRSLRQVNYNHLNDDVFESDTLWLRSNLNWQPSEAFQLRNQIYYYDSYRNWRNVESYQLNAGEPETVTRSWWGNLDHDHQLIGDRLDGLVVGSIGSMQNRIVVGMDVNQTEFETKRNGFPGSDTVDAFNPPVVDFISVAGVYKSPARDVTIDQWSVFLEDQLSITDQFKLVGGWRHDKFSTDWIYLDQAGSPSESKTHSFDSWRAGAVYDISSSTTVYVSYSTAAEPGGTLLLLNRNQSQLDLTTAKQIELGLKQSFWNEQGEWTAAVYEIEKENLFVTDPLNPSNRLPVGSQSSEGVELSIGLLPTAQWRIDGNIAYVNAQYDDYSTGNPPVSFADNTPPGVPTLTANLGARYNLNESWAFGAWASYVDEVYTNDANTVKLPEYTTLDLSLDYSFNQNTDVGFRVRNATDEFYATWYYASQAVIANPRNYELSLRMTF
ncbi:MAG: TonB-dependent receptor [Pseudomonadota bacterium]